MEQSGLISIVVGAGGPRGLVYIQDQVKRTSNDMDSQ